MRPSATQLTVTPVPTSSRARCREKPIAAALPAPYSETPVGRPMRPASDETVTIRPQPRSHIPSTVAFAQCSTP